MSTSLEITVDLDAFLRDMGVAHDVVMDGAERGFDNAANTTIAMKRRFIQETYDRGPRIGPSGPEWEQTGAWMAGQVVQHPAPLTREITTQGEAVAYESWLANLPTGPDGINRTNRAAARAEESARLQAPEQVADGIRSEIRRRNLADDSG